MLHNCVYTLIRLGSLLILKLYPSSKLRVLVGPFCLKYMLCWGKHQTESIVFDLPILLLSCKATKTERSSSIPSYMYSHVALQRTML